MRKAFTLILSLVGLTVWSQPKSIEAECLRNDDPVLSMLDSLMVTKYFAKSKFTTDTLKLNHNRWRRDEVPTFSDDVYSKRLATLDKRTPFKLTFNEPVKAYIRAYSTTHRDKVSRFLGLAQLYFPLFEEVLDKHNLPLEFKYLAVVESALNPNARSRSGATGLWQFMYRTGKIYDLDVTSYLDERSDPYLATEAACQYFKFLYSMFGDWNLVLAAYNGGPGTLTKAIRRSGGKKDYWELRPYLPEETRGYVPAFIAVNYIMNHASDHNIYPIEPEFFSYELDTVRIKKQLTLANLAAATQMDLEQLQFLNPMFRKGVVPASDEGMTLIMPKQKVGIYLANEAELLELEQTAPPLPMAAVVDSEPAAPRSNRTVHSVRSGETLSSISAKFRVTVNELRDWNGLSSTALHVGQKLVIYPGGGSQALGKQGGGERYHTVQKGDTLLGISKEYGVSIDKIKQLSGLSDRSTLHVGQKIRIG